jgi:hypothetical protein
MSVPASQPHFIAGSRYIPAEKETPMLPVSFTHWDRIRGRVSGLGDPPVDRVNWETLGWGIALTSALTFIGYLSQDGRPRWALPLYGLAALFAALFAYAVRRFRFDEAEARAETAKDVCAEMDAHKVAYEEETKGEPPAHG